jgi:hypothetical protein
MHKLRTSLAVGLGSLSLAALSLAAAAPAGASTIETTSNPALAGYQAPVTSWNFRYIATTFTVPEYACNYTSPDSFESAGVALNFSSLTSGGGLSGAGIGVTCYGSTPMVGWSVYSLNHLASSGMGVARDDTISVSVYYDQTTGYDYFSATDQTTGQSFYTWAHKAGAANYHSYFVGDLVSNPLTNPPPPGSNYVLTPFWNTLATSYDGTHGYGGGLYGQWGWPDMVAAYNGAWLIAEAPVLYSTDGGDYNTFNVREYGNA